MVRIVHSGSTRPASGPAGRVTEPPASPWTDPYVLAALTGAIALFGIVFWHFFLARPGVTATAGGGPSGGSGYFGRRFGSAGPGLDLPSAELAALGATGASTTAQPGRGSGGSGAAPKVENFRERRRIYAFTKLDGINRRLDERQRDWEALRKRRQSPAATAVREALESMQENDNLGLMQLETVLRSEMSQGGADENNRDLLLFGYQTLTETLSKKAQSNPTPELMQRTREAMTQYLALLKQTAPPEAGPSVDAALAEISGPLPTPGGRAPAPGGVTTPGN